MAAKMLVGRINTWFAFPEWFTYKEPVNTLTVPKSTPGGLASQFSSIGHYSLTDDEAMIVTVPVSECDYQAIQIGSRWYISTDYEHHQTSLTRSQSHADPDGKLRYVVSERNPGIANWLETCGHPQGVMMLRWQRLSRSLDAADGPEVEVVPFDSLAERLPHFAENQISAERVHRPHRRPPGRHRPKDDLVNASPQLLQDKVVVLSGVGPGLGRSLGEEAAKLGADLVLVSRTQKRLDKMAEVVRSHGRRALVVPTDINDEDACQTLVDATLEEYGRVDCLLNNAFAIPPMEPLTTHQARRPAQLAGDQRVRAAAALDAVRRRARRVARARSSWSTPRCCGSRSRSSPATS